VFRIYFAFSNGSLKINTSQPDCFIDDYLAEMFSLFDQTLQLSDVTNQAAVHTPAAFPRSDSLTGLLAGQVVRVMKSGVSPTPQPPRPHLITDDGLE